MKRNSFLFILSVLSEKNTSKKITTAVSANQQILTLDQTIDSRILELFTGKKGSLCERRYSKPCKITPHNTDRNMANQQLKLYFQKHQKRQKQSL